MKHTEVENGQDNARQVTSGQPENQTDNGTEQQTAQQAMLDVYDEGIWY